MNNSIQTIPIENLALAFAPVLVVILILYKWSAGSQTSVYAMFRMLLQLLLVGYVLTYVFETNHAWLVVLLLAIMLFVSSSIAMRSTKDRRPGSYGRVFISMAIGGIASLAVVTQGVLGLDPWFLPQYFVPLAGMIFANAMNAVSLAADRFFCEIDQGNAYEDARRTALCTALLPTINNLFAVGLVSVPGMMTGQILAGISPLIAARYQIMIMCMIFGSAGIAAACYLFLQKTSQKTLSHS